MKRKLVLFLLSILLWGGLVQVSEAIEDFHMPLERKEKEEDYVPKKVEKVRVIPVEIETKFLNGDYTGVISETGEMLDRRRVKDKDKLLYLCGRSYIKLGEFEKARHEFSEIFSKFPRSQILDTVYLSWADSYLEEGNTQEAMNGYEKVIRNFPSSSVLNMALFQMGECERRKGRWEEAKRTLQELKTRYPHSLEARQADEILKNNEFFFTVQVGSYRYEVNAEEAKGALIKRGYKAYISVADVGGRRLYRVRVGKFDTIDEAKRLHERLKKEGLSCVIFP